ncbi:MAG: universal stress protein [Elainellaceae cyanobacterium]
MFHRILVALDHSERDNDMYEKGRDLAQALKAELLLLHVLDFHDAESPHLPSSVGMEYAPDVYHEAMAMYWQQEREYEQQQLKLLRARADNAIANGVAASVSLTKGSAGPLVCRQAKVWNADLVLVGSRGRSSIQEILLGSVSQYVNHHAPCSVLIVHSQNAMRTEAPAEDVTAEEAIATEVTAATEPIAVHAIKA